jgi:hypothetical protein
MLINHAIVGIKLSTIITYQKTELSTMTLLSQNCWLLPIKKKKMLVVNILLCVS